MTQLRRLFFHRWLATLIGCALLALLVWFLGPLVAIAGVAPLEDELARWLAIAGIFLIWAIVTAIGVVRARRRDRALVRGLTAAPDAGEAEIALLKGRIEATLKHLKAAPGGGGRHLYELPWYMLIGPPGAGKTTALARSGISFVNAEGRGVEAVRGVAGTRNCDWWFAEDAVLLDTAGRYMVQDSDREADRKAWLGFIDLLKTYRPRAPINGAIVATPLVELAAMSDDDRRAHARMLRERLAELREKLGVEFPVYVLFTKLDRAAGFVEFFEGLKTKEERRQAWGFTLPLVRGKSAEPPVAKIHDELEQLLIRLSDTMLDRLQEESDPQRRMLIHGFPTQIGSLRTAAAEFLDGLFSQSRYEHGTLLRGVYLTSGTQEGTPVDRITGMLARSFGLPEARLAALTGGGRSYFLGDVLEKVVFPEARLVSTDPLIERRLAWTRRVVYLASSAAILIALGLWSWSALTNVALIDQAAAMLPPYRDGVAPYADKAARDPDLRPILPSLDRLRAIAGIDQPPAPFSAGFGLYQGGKLEGAGMQSYRRALNALLLPRLLLQFDGFINATMEQPALQYEVLKAYLMLGDAGPLDKAQIEQLMVDQWALTYPDPSDAKTRETLKKHLDALLSGPLANIPLDNASIGRARANLSKAPLAERAYAATKASAEALALPEWRIIDHAGPSADQVLVRRSNKPLTDGVPGLFTRDGFYHVFLPHFAEAAEALAAERWVLGSAAQVPTATEAKALETNIVQLYETEFISRWDAMLGDLAIVPFHSNTDAARIVGILASPTSPFPTLFRAVVQETQLTKPPEELAVAAQLAPGRTAELQRTAAKLGQLGQAAGIMPTGPQPGAAVEQHFRRLAQYAGTGTGAAPIDDTMRSLNDTYLQLNRLSSSGSDLLHGSAAADSGAGLRKLQADAAQLPQPLGGMIGSIGQGATALNAAGTREQLRSDWNSAVLPYCTQALEGRYPIRRDSQVDVTLDDFVRLFATGGQIDAFFNANMKPFVDNSRVPWRWQRTDAGDLGLGADALAQFQRAAKIRDGFFAPGGGQPAMKFQITPTALDAGTKQAILEIDAVSISYAHGPPVPSTVQWPSPTGGGQVRLALQPVDDSTTPSLTATGPWAWFRLLDQAKIESGGAGDRMKLTFTLGAHQVSYDLQAGSVLNPLTLRDVGEFRCPRM